MFVKKLIIGSVLLFMGISYAYAESIEEEIERLKRENKELLSSISGGYENTGWFVGAELGVAPNVDNHLSVASTGSYNFGSSSKTATPFNLIFGYQYYFTHNMGLSLKGLLGYANYDSNITIGYEQNHKFKSSAIHYGIDLSYLYDFISSSKHTFGLNASIGYEFGSFSSTLQTRGEETVFKQKLGSYTASSFTASYGVHYFLNNTHQFWLTYKYRSGYPLNAGSESIVEQGDTYNVKYSSKPKSLIMVSYAYKF